MSQPYRAVYCFMKLNNIPFEVVEKSIVGKDRYTAEYKKLSPHSKIPTIVDGDFTLWESHAILRYLHQSKYTPDHWYPADPMLRGRVDQYLDWHHQNIRIGLSGYIVLKYMKKPASPAAIDEYFILIKKSLLLIENFWLKDPEQKYLINNELTIADLSAACEIGTLLGFENEGINLEKDYPKV